MGVYDMSVQRTGVTVQVVETVTEEDQVEIICPDVIHPGDYFTCVVDIPTGTDLKAKIEMTDDLNGAADESPYMHVPRKAKILSCPFRSLMTI